MLMALDVGDARVGVAIADEQVRIPIPKGTIELAESDFAPAVAELIRQHGVSKIVVGYPRNQSGEATKQTEKVEKRADEIRGLGVDIVFQDESLTSVMAEDRLKQRGQDYTKGDIDAEAAVIILTDYLEGRS